MNIPFSVPRERRSAFNPARAEFTRKCKGYATPFPPTKDGKCGCRCMSMKKGWTGSLSYRDQKLTPPNQRPRCTTCRKYHYGKCRKLTWGYYRCGEIGHRARGCPKPSRKSRRISTGHTEGAETSVAQDAHSQVSAQVFDSPRPEAKVASEMDSGMKFRDEFFLKRGELL